MPPCTQQTPAPPTLPMSAILSKRLTRAHHRARHLSGLFDQKIPNTARIPDKYAPQFVDFQQTCSNMGEARHQICPDLILHVDSPWTLAISIWPGVLIKHPKLHAKPTQLARLAVLSRHDGARLPAPGADSIIWIIWIIGLNNWPNP